MGIVGRERPHPLDLIADGAMPQVRYERELTVGGIGTLWLGRLTSGAEAGRTVLLRRLSHDLFSPKDLDAVKQVAKAYSRVRHPTLMKLLGVIEQDGDLVSVSEHLDGVRLSDLLRHAFDTDSPLPATVAVRIVLDAARATIKAHSLAGELGLYPTERLFVPEGVFVAAFGGTLLTETGILAAMARCSQPRKIPDFFAQLAPEELETAPPCKGSPEVFSLGVILWEALANRSLFSRDSLRQVEDDLRGLAIAPLNRIERCGMPVPDALAEVVRIATSRDPGERYPTLELFVLALEQLPAHFTATEHHVATALRNQAAQLLQAFHVDPSQSSLTMAFSEVPASRFSTRPPPEGSHNWDPPTFNQSSLVSNGLRALAQSDSGIKGEFLEVATSMPAPGIGPEPASPGRQRQRHLTWLAAGLFVVTALLLMAYYFLGRSATPIIPESRRIPVSITPPGLPTPLPAAAESTISQGAATTGTQAAASAPSVSSDPREPRPKASSIQDPSASSTSEVVVPAPGSKRPGGAYRPRQIAPYRPKGI